MSAGFLLAGENGRLILAVPSKGRMAPPALELCAAAGLRFEATERALHVPNDVSQCEHRQCDQVGHSRECSAIRCTCE